MRQSRNVKSARGKPSRPKLEACGDEFFLEKALKAFSAFQDEPCYEPISPDLGFCYIKTNVGVLQVDIGWLLILIGGIVQRARPKKPGSAVEILLDDDALDATVEVVGSVRRYIERDLLGMLFEADFLVKAKRLGNLPVPIDKPYTAKKMFDSVFSSKEKRKFNGSDVLGHLLGTPYLPALLVPGVLEAIVDKIAELNPAATNGWRSLIDKHFGRRRKRGRRSEELYDTLFRRRAKDPSLSYGKLALEVVKAKNIEFAVAREQVKAAISYRRKKLLAERLQNLRSQVDNSR